MRWRLPTVLGLTVAFAAASTTLATAAFASTATTPLSHLTGVGAHNTYQQSAYPYLANGLDAGLSLVELDVWADALLHKWHVGHDNPWGSSNNCATSLYSGTKNQDLPGCLKDLQLWGAANPTHKPVVVKIELKAGFDGTHGMSASVLDSIISSALGSQVFRPADLLAGTFPTLDAAAQADAWPTQQALAGKYIFEIIPGTVEEQNPFDHLWTDLEYAQHLRDLAAAGQIGSAEIFPSVHNAATGDPRTRYTDTTVRPWFIFFDGDAAAYVSGVDTSWYDVHHYFLIMTDAQNVAPALSDTAPSLADAQARIALLAKDHASIASTDWEALPSVLGEVLNRG
jgi:hypothetical protein